MAGSKNKQHGFTLLEVLLSVGIITALAGLSLPVFMSFNNRNDLDLAAQVVADSLRRAEVYSRGVSGDSQWGVKVQPGAVVLFKGATYATRNTDYDETTSISGALTVGGSDETVFSKLGAAPSGASSIVLASSSINETRTVTINAKGMVDY